MPNSTYPSALVLRSMSLGAILNHLEAMRISQCHNWIHITRPSGQMHANHSFCARRQNLGNSGCGNIPTVSLHIRKHGRGACIYHTGNTGNESARRHHHFIAWTNTQRLEGHIQRKRAITQGHGIARTTPGGKLLFKLAALGARPVIDRV